MTYMRGDKAQFDAWEQLGNPGWNWSTLLPYFKKVERLFPPEPWQVEVRASVRPEHHGHDGPVHVGFAPALQNGSLYRQVRELWAALGVGVNDDVNGGATRGLAVYPQTLDPRQNRRWDAATAFFWPVAGRRNLRLLNGTAARVVWRRAAGAAGAAGAGGRPEAEGVEYIAADGRRRTARAGREVVLAAGALRTPPLLERSGVGQAWRLRRRGVGVVVDLPGVGENLMEQPQASLVYASRRRHDGLSPYAAMLTARDVLGGGWAAGRGRCASSTRSSSTGARAWPRW